MKNLLLVFLLTSMSGYLYAQSYTLKGQVKNQQNEVVSFATIAVHTAKDSALAKADIADENGGFKIANIAKGKYFIKVTAVGFSPYASAAFEVVDKDIDFQPFVVGSDTKQLNEVKVVASKPLIEVKNDKVIFNVEGSINATGSNGLELLQKSPGVQVDKDENILIKGKTGVRIYIDGRPSPMSGKDLLRRSKV